MSEFEVKRDKTKSFKASAETINKIDELIKLSGKGATEFFEDLVTDLAITSVTDPDDETISTDLRKHFESDVARLKNATNSVLSLFVNQMENISVEKNQWEQATEKKLNEKQEEFDKLTALHDELKQELEESKQQFTELTKVNETNQKELEILTKRTQDQEQLIQDRTEKIMDFQNRINQLNENIVQKDEQLKAFEPIEKELAAAKQEITALEQERERLVEEHENALVKKEDELNFAFEKEKHKLESTLKDQFAQEKEELRNTVRRETEIAIREFYLEELKRKESRIEELQKQKAIKKELD